MDIKTIGDLKKAIEQFQKDTGRDDNYPVLVPVQSYTKAYAQAQCKISFITGAYSAMSICVHLPEHMHIVERKK